MSGVVAEKDAVVAGRAEVVVAKVQRQMNAEREAVAAAKGSYEVALVATTAVVQKAEATSVKRRPRDLE